MDLEASLTTTASTAAVLAYVAELDRYPKWMPLVHAAERVEGTDSPTWNVELRAKVGPFARSKRLRMERTYFDRDIENGASTYRIVFERRENDSRQHATWRLEAHVIESGAAGTNLIMRLHYDGRFFAGIVESILQQNIDDGRRRLGELLAR